MRDRLCLVCGYIALLILGILYTTMSVPSYAQITAPISPVAVVPLQNLSPENEWAWMSQAIGDTIVTKLSKVRGLQVLERAQVEKALVELGLPLEGVVDNETAPQVGRFVGARGIILGSYIVTKDNFLRISVRLINVESSEILVSEQVTSEIRNAGDIFRAIDQLALGLLETMGYELTEQEKQKVTAAPTKSIPALEAKTKAQTELGKGKEEEALRHVNQALKDDPGYGEAKDLKRYLLTKQGRWFWSALMMQAGDASVTLIGISNPASIAEIPAPNLLFQIQPMPAAHSVGYHFSLTYIGHVMGSNVGLSIYRNHTDCTPSYCDKWTPTGFRDISGDATRLTLGLPISVSEELTFGVGWTYGFYESLREYIDTGVERLGSAFHQISPGLQYATKSLTVLLTPVEFYHECRWNTWISSHQSCFSYVDFGHPTALIRIRPFEGCFLQFEVEPSTLFYPRIIYILHIIPNLAVYGRLDGSLIVSIHHGIFFNPRYSFGGVVQLGNVSLGVNFQATIQAFVNIGF